MNMFDDGWKDKRMTFVYDLYLDYACLHRRLVSGVNESERASPPTRKSRAGDQSRIFVALTLGV